MSEETKSGSAGKGLGIAGLVLGILALVISFIPCLGMYAVVPGVIAIILSAIGLASAAKNQGAKGLNIAALIISILGTAIAGYQYYVISSAAESFGDGMIGALEAANKEYASCEEIATDLDVTLAEVEEKYGNVETMDASDAMSMAGDLMTISSKIANINAKAVELGCAEDADFAAKMEQLNTKLSSIQAQ